MTSILIDGAAQRQAFALWLRIGRRPTVTDTNVELKFNPWHDPDDGRFTYADTGRRYGPGDAIKDHGGRRRRPPAADSVRKTASDAPIEKVAEFISGFGQGVRDVGKETVTSLREVVTNNPITTVRRVGEGIARTIDAAVAAENIPARGQARRANHFVATASAHDLGYATGQVAGNAGLAVAPGGAATKISTMRRLRTLRPRETFRPPQILWRKENISKEAPSTAYNDTATGARPGQAPALTRLLSNGSRRPVKFDGIDGDYLVDRKWKVVDAPHSRAAALRQSDVLAQHRLTATWEVPNEKQKVAALKIFKKNWALPISR